MTNTHRSARRASILPLLALPLLGAASCGSAEEPVAASGEQARPGVAADRPDGELLADSAPGAGRSAAFEEARDLGGRYVHGVQRDASLRTAALLAPPPRRVPGAPSGTSRPVPTQPNTAFKPTTGPAGLRAAKTQYAADMNPNAKLSVEFGTEKHDFGAARQGDVLEHTFALQSTGSEGLVIRQASPTCGCTLGKLTVENDEGEMVEYTLGETIAPGRRVDLSAILNTAGKRHKADVKIHVYHNDPIGLTTLGLSANVTPFISAMPTFVNFGEISVDDQKTQVVDVRTAQAERVALSIDDSRIPKPQGLSVELVAMNPDEDGRSNHWRATISIGPGLKEGPLGYSLSMLTDLDQPISDEQLELMRTKDPNAVPPKYQVSASVSGTVRGVLSHSPMFLTFGLLSPGQRVVRTTRITCHDPEHDLSGLSASIQGDVNAELPWAEYFSVEIADVEGMNAKDVHLTLEGLPEGADGSFRGQLVIETGIAEKPLLEPPIRFSGVCRKRAQGR